MKIIKQSTYETCLPCSLLMIAGKNRKEEIEIWKHGWKFNYLIGQLNYFSKKYNIEIEAYVENKHYCSQLHEKKIRNVKLVNKKIDMKLLSNLLKNSKVIVYLDCYYLQGILHAPHFVVAIKLIKNGVEIADPADGKLKILPIKLIDKAVRSLRSHLKYSPVLVQSLK